MLRSRVGTRVPSPMWTVSLRCRRADDAAGRGARDGRAERHHGTYPRPGVLVVAEIDYLAGHMFRLARARCRRNVTGSVASRRLPSCLGIHATRS